MRIPDPKANTTTEAYLAYKAGYLEESELKPVLYEPYLHFDAWLAYWAGLTATYPVKNVGKNLFNKDKPLEKRYLGGDGAWVQVGTPSYINQEYRLSGVSDLTISFESKTGYPNVRLGEFNGNTFIKRTLVDATPTTVTLSASTNKVIVSIDENNNYFTGLQIELGSSATAYEPYTGEPEMLTDEEALVAYLSGVTDTYPEEIKDPYDVRIVGYLKYLVSARWGRPEYPVNNEEFYLSTMKPPVVPSGDTPSSDIEMDDTVEAPFIDLKMYGDTSQQTYSGKNLFNVYGIGGTSSGANSVSYTVENEELTVTQVGTSGNGFVWVRLDKDKFLGKELTLSVGEATSYGGSNGSRIRLCNQNGGDISGVSFTFYPDDETSETFSVPSELPSGVTELRLYIYVNKSNVTGQEGATSKYTKLQIEVGASATSYEPYVGGEPAPNPDYPQEIQTVTGEQTVAVDGKNVVSLLGGSSAGVTGSVNGDGSITISGTANKTGGIVVMGSRQTLKAGTYTMTISKSLPFLINFSVASGVAFRIPAGGTSATTTLTEDYINQGGLFMAMTAGTTYDETFNLQIVAGSTPDYDFVPYRSQSYTINLGKNLVYTAPRTNEGITFSYDSTNGVTTISGTPILNYDISATNSTSIPAGTYTLSIDSPKPFNVGIGTRNASNVRTPTYIPAGGTSVTITRKEPIVGYDIYVSGLTPGIYISDEFRLMLEQGSTATSYAPYFEPIELCKIGDYQDYIYKSGNDWYVHKATGKAIFNGTEEGWSNDTSGSYLRVFHPLENVLFVTGRVADGYSNYFTPSVTNAYGIYLRNRNHVYFYPQSSITTLADFKTWLSTHNINLYYPLATPTDTKITNSELISQLDALMEGGSYEGKTYIKVTAADPNLPGLLYVEAGKYD